MAYSFPSVGKLIEILFIVFTAWCVNQAPGFLEYIDLSAAGVMSLFGSPKVGIPFFDHWILGKTPHRETPRWSIMRNLLH